MARAHRSILLARIRTPRFARRGESGYSRPAASTLPGATAWRHRGRRIPARDQHVRAVEGGLRRVRARRRLAAADLRRRDRAARSPAPTSPPPARSPRCTPPGTRTVGLAWGAASPSAHVTRDAFERIVGDMLARLAAAGPVDGVYLDLHGAMVTEHLDDGEGELLARVRARRRAARADRREPRPARQRHARDDRALRRPRRVPHLSARRHGGDRRARGARCSTARSRRASRSPRALRPLDFLTGLPSQCTFIEPAPQPVRTARAARARARRRAVVHARLSDGRLSRVRDGGVRLRRRRRRACRRAVDRAAPARSPTPKASSRMELFEPDDAVRARDAARRAGRAGRARRHAGQSGRRRQRRHDGTARGAARAPTRRDAVLGLLIDPRLGGAGARRRHRPHGDIHARRDLRRAGHVPLAGEFTVLSARRRPLHLHRARCSRASGWTWARWRCCDKATCASCWRRRKCQAADQEMFRHVGIEPAQRAHPGAQELGAFPRRLRADRARGAGRRRARPGEGRSDDVLVDAAAPRPAAEAARAGVPTGCTPRREPACRAATSSRSSSTRPTRSRRCRRRSRRSATARARVRRGGARALRAAPTRRWPRISISRAREGAEIVTPVAAEVVAVEQGVARDVRGAGAPARGRGARRLRRGLARPARRDGDRGLRRRRRRDRAARCARSRRRLPIAVTLDYHTNLSRRRSSTTRR